MGYTEAFLVRQPRMPPPIFLAIQNDPWQPNHVFMGSFIVQTFFIFFFKKKNHPKRKSRGRKRQRNLISDQHTAMTYCISIRFKKQHHIPHTIDTFPLITYLPPWISTDSLLPAPSTFGGIFRLNDPKMGWMQSSPGFARASCSMNSLQTTSKRGKVHVLCSWWP